MSYPTTNNQHGGTYDPGSAAPVYPVQSRSEEQHGGEYSPGSAGPIYEDRTARPSYDSPTTVQSQFSGHRVPRRPVPAMQAANPTFPQSMTPPSYPPYSHYSAHPGAAYESVPIPPAYATPQSDSRIGYYPPYPEQPQGQYVHRVPAQPVRDSSQPVPCAPPVPGGSNFSGYNSQPQASAYGQYANPSRHGGVNIFRIR
ncbi:hypothetical protein K458DRAFT_169481 [Lentithecium fluviatile CBS 122367]|uniref:Uncharacterized protein n=1 Tax=Lentithecium fluviatile CBS 122367 TaxID=1168545 RepID=A0A6G1JBY9_9PLEO|nr:hypothetical protein K458DRAFT_169481 [Lentithecium fluviatile CBS 122367]